MSPIKIGILIGFILLTLIGTTAFSQTRTTSLIVDHTYTDPDLLSTEQIDAIQAHFRIHYAHTSHGSQITEGLERIANTKPQYNVAIYYSSLPVQADALCIFDGQENETYITPDLYWEAPEGVQLTKNVLNHNQTINISMWAWCCQLEYYDATQVQLYLNTMTALEAAYPHVTFIYMTGNAQSESENRHQLNNLIRQYCQANKKVLFDFADLDCWYNGQQHRIYGVPCEHPHYNGDQAGHTTYESCENKGKAFWYLLAQLVQEQSAAVPQGEPALARQFELMPNYPNPFNPATTITYHLIHAGQVSLKIFNLQGQEILTLVHQFQSAGTKSIQWNGRNGRNQKVPSGVYIYQLQTGDCCQSKKMLLIQ